ncbi:MAG: DNA polymerase III subunit beta [Candidatus Poribacteria bacterium]
MELIFDKEELWKGMQMAGNVAASRNTLPILSNVLLKTLGDRIHLAATDLEIGLKCLINGEIKEPGSITVPAKKISDIVRELPSVTDSNEPTKVRISTLSNDRVEIECERAKFRIVGLPDDEFPPLPEIGDDFLTISSWTLSQMIQKTIFAASTEETRHFLNGIYLHVNGDIMKMVATDGKRLAVARHQLDEPLKQKIGIIIPIKTVNNITRIFTEDEVVKITLLENQVLFSTPNITLISRLIEGEYPDYEAVINPVLKNDIVLTARTEHLLSVIRRVSLLANPKTPSIRIESSNGELNVSASTPDLGEAQEQMQVKTEGGKIEIAFNAKYVMDVLRNVETEESVLKFRDSLSPVMIAPAESDDYLCVIMPMRL